MKRRQFLTTASAGLALGAGVSTLTSALASAAAHARQPGLPHPLWPLWQAWRSAHLDFSGRVIDAPQRLASHSEGQGYGMVLASEFGDADAFRRMDDWTQANLAIRPDALLAWRWLPDIPQRVPDLNNASDGDLFYAWALLRGAERFNRPELRARATEIASDLVRKCVAARPDRPGTPVLLPAEQGFITREGIIFNPSYIMPLALRELASATGESRLEQVAQSGLDLMADLSRGGLVPDWLEITASGPRPAADFSFDTGYEALRVPLFLVWSGEAAHPALREMTAAMAQVPAGQAATVIDSRSGEVLEMSTHQGYRAVAALTSCVSRQGVGAPLPPFAPSQPYYPATLHLFALMVQSRFFPSCLPI
ncbi:MAG: glycosyl hydrolase family 5 [Pararhodobacter sp.]|nr:glycosyl hydrolase family 5 [Pararhodobacter sp.]